MTALAVGLGLTLLLLAGLVWHYLLAPLLRLNQALDQSADHTQEVNQPLQNHPLLKLERDAAWSRHPVGRILARAGQQYNQLYHSTMLDKQAELDALQSQINPHFLYNTLESIRGKAYSEGQQEIAEMTEALSSFFRYSISRKGNDVTLEEELINIQNYFKIQQFRFDNRFQLEIDLPDATSLYHCRLPKLTLQPIVENAIYHGLEEKMGQGKIRITAFANDQRTVITIADNGVGIPEDTLTQLRDRLDESSPLPAGSQGRTRNTGIALHNVNRRLKLMYGPASGLSINSSPGFGTDVEITLPSPPPTP